MTEFCDHIEINTSTHTHTTDKKNTGVQVITLKDSWCKHSMNDICAVLFSTHICAGIGKMKLALLNKKQSDNISGGLGIQEIRNTILECKNII